MSILALLAAIVPIAEQIAALVEKTPAGLTSPLEKVLSEVDAAIASMINTLTNGNQITGADVEALRLKQTF